MEKGLNPLCEVCGVKIDVGKYCKSHRLTMTEYNRMLRFLDSEAYMKLPEIKFKFPLLKKVLRN